MSPYVRVPTTKLKDPSLIPGTHSMDGYGDDSSWLSSDLHMSCEVCVCMQHLVGISILRVKLWIFSRKSGLAQRQKFEAGRTTVCGASEVMQELGGRKFLIQL